MWLRLALLPVVLALSGCGGGEKSAPSSPAPAPVLALVSTGTTAELVRVEAPTLEPAGSARVALGLHDLPGVRSPDGSRVALGSGRATTLLVVDTHRMRVRGELDLRRRIVALTWPRPDRLLAVVAGRCCPPALAVLELDADRLTVVAEHSLGAGSVLGAAATGDGLVVLLGEHDAISTVSVAVAEAGAPPRSASLAGVRAGWERPDPEQHPPVVRFRRPGLAADPSGRRAFVAEPGGTVVEIALDTLVAVRHAPERRASSFGRLRNLLEPSARADGGLGDGQVRQAVWLGDDLLAVTGSDERPGRAADEEELVVEPAGLSVVDTGDWSVRLIAPDVPAVSRALGGRLLVAASWQFGIALYEPDGRVRMRLPPQRLGGVQVAGRYAYLGLEEEYRPHRVAVLDLETATIVSRPVVPGWMRILGDDPTICWC